MTTTREWTAATWRAAREACRPADERLRVSNGHMTADTTSHYADQVDTDRWHVDFLRGRPLTYGQAVRAMQIAAALHDNPDAVVEDAGIGADERARALGLTAREVVGLATIATRATRRAQEEAER